MNLLIPDFIPVLGAEAMGRISMILLIAGVCAAAAGMLFRFLDRRKGKEKNLFAWILICTGLLLAVNHGLQLIF